MAITGYDNIKNEILNRIDILDLASEYVSLKKAGKSYKGLCPFHPEKTPSFHVNQERQMFYCFGCHAGGDAFTFLMKLEGLNFPEALERLGARCGVDVHKGKGHEEKPSERQQILQINQAAKVYFEQNLWKGVHGLDYLRQRGLEDKTIKEFGLGFSYASWDGLLSSLSQSYPAQLILRAGLICQRQTGSGYYDRFRGRVIFPIHNIYGDICGFGGRIINPSEDSPKYLNSPETPVYSKGQILYGLYKSRNAIIQKKQAILVEGYLDMITLFQAGFTNVVATLGTALTMNQVHVIKRYAGEVMLVFDPDTAGKNAAKRGIELFIDQGIKVKVAVLPAGRDPDSMIRDEGKEGFALILKEARPFIDFLLHMHEITGKLGVQEKARKMENIIPFLANMKDPIERDGYIHYIAHKTEISEDALRQSIRQGMGTRKKVKPDGTRAEDISSQENGRSTERLLIQLALEMGNPSQAILQNVGEADFKDPDLRALAGMILDRWRRGVSIEPSRFLMEVENENQKRLITQVMVAGECFEDTVQAVQDCIRRFQQEKINRQLKDIKERLDSASLSEHEEDILLGEYRRLKMECIF
ncbi:DNA primase [bacterium]|nr:DNA primase [bacterium]